MTWTYHDDMERIPFDTGATLPVAAEILTGAVSAKTAIVSSVVISSGTFLGGNAAGYIYVYTISGAFQTEALNGSIGGASIVAATGDAEAGFDNLNWLRRKINDTDTAFPLFTDNELNGMITRNTTVADVVLMSSIATLVLKALAVDVDRLSILADKMAGAMRTEGLMDLCWQRAEAIGG